MSTPDDAYINYAAYLASPAWAARRRQVFLRSGGICEGCGSRPIADVHHLTYAHVGDELLYELVGLCSFCHRKIHNRPAGGDHEQARKVHEEILGESQSRAEARGLPEYEESGEHAGGQEGQV